jgi:rhodanese-related sulfurtransferase
MSSRFGLAKYPACISAVREISAPQLQELSQRLDYITPSPTSPQIIDVRTPEEYKAGHVPNSINVSFFPAEDFEAR